MPRSSPVIRLIGISIAIYIVYFLLTTGASDSTSSFRKSTEAALARKHSPLQGDLSDEQFREQTAKKLKEIKEAIGGDAVRHADPAVGAEKSVKKPKAGTDRDADSMKPVVDGPRLGKGEAGLNDGKEQPIAGRKTMPKGQKDKDPSVQKYPIADSQGVLGGSGAGDLDTKKPLPPGVVAVPPVAKAPAPKDPVKDAARVKLQEYLKKPIVIFSKSYCPHSKRAKQLLLETYDIEPKPEVVELDLLSERISIPASSDSDADSEKATGEDDAAPAAADSSPTLGRAIQDLLGDTTGRKTVPNIMIGMASIGGNDDIQQMHHDGTLIREIQTKAGKRITSIKLAGT